MSAHEPPQRPDGSGSLQVFVLDVDRRPTLAFEADGLAAAQEIFGDADLLADLTTLTSDGGPPAANWISTSRHGGSAPAKWGAMPDAAAPNNS